MEVHGREAGLAESPELVIGVEDATVEPYATILSYPKADKTALASRIRQLHELGVRELEFVGRLRLGRLSLLGKGVAGMVVIGRNGRERIALKIRRIDSRRDSVRHEASMLKAANSVDVGPAYYGSTSDIISMELVEGESLPEWLGTLVGRGRRSRLRETAGILLQQCLRLDDAGLDHGELSRAHKNVSVSREGGPVILDFESASWDRRPSNVTSITQYFFLGGGFARRAHRILGPTDIGLLKQALRSYKFEKSPDAFCSLLKLLRLQL